jgi:hypothetical protein
MICGYLGSEQVWSLLRLKISGAVPLLSLYAFMAWRATTFVVKVLTLNASETLKNLLTDGWKRERLSFCFLITVKQLCRTEPTSCFQSVTHLRNWAVI